MYNSKAEMRRTIHLCLALILLFTFFFNGLFATISDPDVPLSISPILHLRAYGHGYFTLSRFLILLAIFGGGIGYMTYTGWCNERQYDPLNPSRKYAQNKPYDDAHFMDPDEYAHIAQIRPIEDCKGVILGQLTSDGSECIDFNPVDGRRNSHMFVVGASGSGKTYGFVKDYFLQSIKAGHSLVVFDPDGGLYRDLAHYARTHGCLVRLLNMQDAVFSNGWDVLACLKGLKRHQLGTQVEILADSIISNIPSIPAGTVYASGGKALLKALILRVYLGHDFPPEKKTIKTVYSLLNDEGGLEYLDQLFSDDLLTKDEKDCKLAYNSFHLASGALAGNVVTNVSTGLGTLQGETIADVLSTDDIDLTLPGKQQCVYFVSFPDIIDTYAFVSSLFFSSMFIALVGYADNVIRGKLAVPVDLLLDEFPQAGKLPVWDQKISVVRKRNINIVMIAQGIGQLMDRYTGAAWETIISNCASIIVLGVNDGTTARWLSTRIGETSVETRSYKEDTSAFGLFSSRSGSESVGIGKTPLISVSAIQRLKEDEMLIIFQRMDTILCRPVPHTIHPESQYLVPTNLDDEPTFYDRDKRLAMFAQEQKDIAEYRRLHPLILQDTAVDNTVVEQEDWYSMSYFEAIKSIVVMDYAAIRSGIAKFRDKRGSSQADQEESVAEAEYSLNNLSTSARHFYRRHIYKHLLRIPLTRRVIVNNLLNEDDDRESVPAESAPIVSSQPAGANTTPAPVRTNPLTQTVSPAQSPSMRTFDFGADDASPDFSDPTEPIDTPPKPELSSPAQAEVTPEAQTRYVVDESTGEIVEEIVEKTKAETKTAAPAPEAKPLEEVKAANPQPAQKEPQKEFAEEYTATISNGPPESTEGRRGPSRSSTPSYGSFSSGPATPQMRERRGGSTPKKNRITPP